MHSHFASKNISEKNYKSIALDSHFAELSNESCKAEIGNKKRKRNPLQDSLSAKLYH